MCCGDIGETTGRSTMGCWTQSWMMSLRPVGRRFGIRAGRTRGRRSRQPAERRAGRAGRRVLTAGPRACRRWALILCNNVNGALEDLSERLLVNQKGDDIRICGRGGGRGVFNGLDWGGSQLRESQRPVHSSRNSTPQKPRMVGQNRTKGETLSFNQLEMSVVCALET